MFEGKEYLCENYVKVVFLVGRERWDDFLERVDIFIVLFSEVFRRYVFEELV